MLNLFRRVNWQAEENLFSVSMKYLMALPLLYLALNIEQSQKDNDLFFENS